MTDLATRLTAIADAFEREFPQYGGGVYREAADALASITRERDEARLDAKAYREVAVQEGWSFAMERAYARADYQRQREEHVDMRADVVRRAAALVNVEGGK